MFSCRGGLCYSVMTATFPRGSNQYNLAGHLRAITTTQSNRDQ